MIFLSYTMCISKLKDVFPKRHSKILSLPSHIFVELSRPIRKSKNHISNVVCQALLSLSKLWAKDALQHALIQRMGKLLFSQSISVLYKKFFSRLNNKTTLTWTKNKMHQFKNTNSGHDNMSIMVNRTKPNMRDNQEIRTNMGLRMNLI